MRKFVLLFLKGIGLGLAVSLCLAGFVGLAFRAVHSQTPGFNPGHATVYFFVVGGFMGLFGGWCFSLQMVLGNLLASLFMKVADLVPLPAQAVGEEWARKMETFFQEIIQPFPGFIRKFIGWIFILRFEDYGRINRALEKARRKDAAEGTTTQWMLMVILHYLLEPLWLLFWAVYAILLLISCIFWSFPFFR
jgi:hypothetical protein